MEYRKTNLSMLKSNSSLLPKNHENAPPEKQEPTIAPPVGPVSDDISVTTVRNLFEGGADDLVKGIILAEVLGKPLSRRNRR